MVSIPIKILHDVLEAPNYLFVSHKCCDFSSHFGRHEGFISGCVEQLHPQEDPRYGYLYLLIYNKGHRTELRTRGGNVECKGQFTQKPVQAYLH